MDTSTILDYYLALLQVQMAILGFVIAGVVTLIQMLNSAKPRRQTRLLIRHRELYGYTAFLSALLFFIAMGCWVAAFPESASKHFGQAFTDTFLSGGVLLIVLALSIAGLFGFVALIFKARRLLDAEEYLKKYVQRAPTSSIRKYLAAIYDTEPVVPPATRKGLRARSKYSSLQKYLDSSGMYDVSDPFQPVREYIKDNAFKMYDYGTAAGLKLFSKMFDKALSDVTRKPKANEYYYLAKYLSESMLEFFSIFQKTSSEKRKMDVIRLVYAKGELLMAEADSEGLLTIVRTLEDIAVMTDDDDEIIACVGAIKSLTDSYLARHKKAKWNDISQTFEEICMSVTRLSENYYLQKNNPLKTVPIIGHDTGEFRTVTAVLIEFFTSYKNLADIYTDIYPVHYFEAIEAVVEALFARLADFVGNRESTIGRNAIYHDLASSLYNLYMIFGLDAIEHKKPELLALSMGNLRRVIKPAKNLQLRHERMTLTVMFVELAMLGISELGDIPLKGERTISMYTIETLGKHAASEDIAIAFDGLDEKEIALTMPEQTSLKKRLQKI